MPAAIDLTGRADFGRLTVTGRSKKPGRRLWDCVCECGAVCTVRGDNLASGHTTSCGCVKEITSAENIEVARVARLAKGYASTRGENHHRAKLKAADVLDIRAAVAAGETGVSAAARYGVSESTISMLVSGRTWKSV